MAEGDGKVSNLAVGFSEGLIEKCDKSGPGERLGCGRNHRPRAAGDIHLAQVQRCMRTSF